jgi:tRNA dimethylallyltransferase
MGLVNKNKTVLLLAGPTAVGKTAVAIDLARHFDTEIISADSRQCYRELKIGVARPSEKELKEVKHHFIASHSIHEKINAISFEKYALQKTNEVFENRDVVVVVGGTGLYIKAFCEGMDEIPEIPESLRNEITEGYRLHGLEWLQQEVQQLDPLFFREGEIQNPRRLMRALEIAQATGQPVSTFRKGAKEKRAFDIVKIGLQLPKEELHRRIDIRVDQMMEQGLLEEARSLIPYRQLNALQTVGYKELFDHFDGTITLKEAVALIKRNTKQYAKRQLTWFRKDKAVRWTEPDAQKLLDMLKENG